MISPAAEQLHDDREQAHAERAARVRKIVSGVDKVIAEAAKSRRQNRADQEYAGIIPRRNGSNVCPRPARGYTYDKRGVATAVQEREDQ